MQEIFVFLEMMLLDVLRDNLVNYVLLFLSHGTFFSFFLFKLLSSCIKILRYHILFIY